MISHTFAICAYKESPFLEACIKSILNQSIKSSCIICTSTPNNYIISLAKKYNLPLYTRQREENENSIAEDWNFAISKANTEYCTLAHQDDIYLNKYTENILKELSKSKNPLIAFSDYVELRNLKKSYISLNLKIKRLMLSPLKYKLLRKSKHIRRLILSFGTPICCPSVCFAKKHLTEPIFSNKLKCSLDWLTWANISTYNGDFIYINKVLMYHRIHKDSETTKLINHSIRQEEDSYMFSKFWPKVIAKLLTKMYLLSLKNNN